MLRRLDCVLEGTIDQVKKEYEKLKAQDKHETETIEKMINHKFDLHFHNTSGFTFERLKGDPDIKGVNEEIDKFYKNSDKYLLNFKNHIKTKIGEAFYPLIDYSLVGVENKDVLRVTCGASTAPCFLEDNEFYVRGGPSTDLLTGRTQHEYIKKRF